MRTRAGIVLLVAMAVTPPAVFADYRDSFAEGIKAFDRQNWEDVRRFMSEAIAQQSVEGGRVRIYGTRFRTYIPYFYLGIAHYNLGNCEAALEAWKKSDGQGVIAGESAEYGQMKQLVEDCRSRIVVPKPKPDIPIPVPKKIETPPPETPKIDSAQFDAAFRRASLAINSATKTYERLKKIRTDQEARSILDSDRSLSTAWSEAESLLTRAQSVLEESRKGADTTDLQQLAEAEKLASDASRRFDKFSVDLTARLDAMRDESTRGLKEREQALERRRLELSKLQTAVRDARIAAGRTEGLRNPTSEIPRLNGSLEELLSHSRTLDANTPIEELVRTRLQIEQLTVSLNRAVDQLPPDESSPRKAAVPVSLLAAARSYFQGDYRTTVSILEPESFDTNRSRAYAELFLAAARYALYVLDGERDEDLRKRARDHVANVKRLDSTIVPDREEFSPRFVAFFSEAS